MTGMPDPKVVIAVGTDAASGGLLGDRLTGWPATCPVDVLVPGSPAESVRNTECPADRDGKAAMTAVLGGERFILLQGDPPGGGRGPVDHGGRAGRAACRTPLARPGPACLAVAGGFALAGPHGPLNVAGWLGDPLPGQQALGLAADRLSGLFLVMALGAAVPVSAAFASWAAGPVRPGQCGHADAGRGVRAGAWRHRGGHDGDRTRSPPCSAGRR